MKISVILPIFNEEAGIKQSIQTVLAETAKLFTTVEILAVNDGSIDKTGKILKQLSQKDPRIKVISHETNLGYGAALRTGMQHASAEWIFFTDADMQFDIAELKKFLPKMKDYDFIIGYRKNRADALQRRMSSGVYNRVIRLLFGLRVRDVDCAFKLMKKSAMQKTAFQSNSFFVSVELMVRAFKKKFAITEIGVTHYPRQKGASTVTVTQMKRSIVDLARLYKSLI